LTRAMQRSADMPRTFSRSFCLSSSARGEQFSSRGSVSDLSHVACTSRTNPSGHLVAGEQSKVSWDGSVTSDASPSITDVSSPPMYRAHQSTVVRPHVSCAAYETERFLEGAAVNQSPNRTSRHRLLRLALLDCCVSSRSRRVVIGQILAQLTTKYVPMMVADLISCTHGNQGLFTTTKGVACMSLRRFARYLHRSHTSGLSECQISRTPSSKNGLMC
jgi:hypothetical protein